MGHTLRCDTSPLIAGRLVVGDPGLGVLGSEVPCGVTGIDDPPGCNDSLTADSEYQFLVTTWPTSGTLIVEENSSFSYEQPTDGSYYFEYQLVEDGVDVGSPVRVDLNVGAVVVSGVGAGVLEAITAFADGTLYGSESVGVGAGILTEINADATGAFVPATIYGVGAGVLSAITADATGILNYNGSTGVAAGTLQAITASALGDINNKTITGTAAGTLQKITASAYQTKRIWFDVDAKQNIWTDI